MDNADIAAFLSGIQMAVMATINSDGSPHLSPNWYYYDGDQLFFVTTKERKKFYNVRKDLRLSVCVYEPPLASNYVVVEGAAKVDDLVPTSELWRTARLVIERYVNAEDVENYIDRWKTEPRILVTITPTRIHTRPGH